MARFKRFPRLSGLLDSEEACDELAAGERAAALDARDRSLMERFLAREKAAEREVVARLDSMGRLVALRFWPRLLWEWENFCGEYFATLHRYREEGLLRLDEPLRFLAQRLLRHSGRKAGLEAHRDRMTLSFSGPLDKGGEAAEPGWAAWLEREAMASVAAQPRFGSPEAALGAKKELEWLAKAKLSPSEREMLEAEQAVARGKHESLAEALGVSDEAAWQRRSRLKKALRRLAEETGATEILERLEARMQPRPAR
ncbi:MAG: hypothetical protein ACYDCL_00210 [Myxococcales bacterium]